MYLVKNARTSLVSSARTFQDRLPGKNATTSRGRFATVFQERFATTSLVSNARTSLVSSARMYLVSSATTSLASSAEMSLHRSATTSQEKFATMFPANSASKFPSRFATLPSQPTAESRLRELGKTRKKKSLRRITRGAPKRHLKLSSKLPGWSQQSYLFLLCNIYGILVKPRVLS